MFQRISTTQWIVSVTMGVTLMTAPWQSANAQDGAVNANDYENHHHTPGDGVLYGPEAPPEAAPAQESDAEQRAERAQERAQKASEAAQRDADRAREAATDAKESKERAQKEAQKPAEKSTERAQAEDSEDDPTADQPAASTASQRPNVSIGEGGLRVQSTDGKFALGLTPFVQMGYRQVASDFGDSAASGFVLEHFRPTLTGKYNEILSYNFILQITPSNINILNAFVTFHAHPKLNIRVGLQKPVFGIELRQAQWHMLFYNRSLASTIGAARDIGLALDARILDDLQFEIGVYNGTEDTRVFSGIQEKSVAGDAGVRWYALGNDRPTADSEGFLTLGAAALLRRNEGNAATSHLTPRNSAGGHNYANYAQGAFADGRKFASTVFAHGGYKGFYFQGEFTTSNQQVSDATDQGRIVEHAWQASATYTLGGVTGWTGTTPNRSLFEGGLGALQIKARGHGLSAHSREGEFLAISGNAADSLSAIGASAGLSWHISHGLRIQGDYNWTTFGANGNRLGKANEHVFFLGLTAGY